MAISTKKGSPYYWYDFYVAGERYRGSTKQKTKTKAQQVEAALIHDAMAGIYTNTYNRAPSLTDFAPRFLAFINEGRLEDKTKEYYRSGWRLMKSQPIAAMRMDTITTSSATSITAPGGGSSVNSALRTLRRMLSLASEWKLIQRVPKICLAKENQRERMITPTEEIVILAKASPTMNAVVTLIMDTGMRPSEAASLAWESVDFVAGVILIVSGKTENARRHLPMAARTRELLMRRAKNGSPWVFPSKRHPGKHVKGSTLTTMFCNMKREMGLPKEVVLYSARHTFATDFLGATGNVAKLKRVMGHSSLATTQRYLHPETADLGSIMDTRNEERNVLGHNFGHSGFAVQ